MSIIVDYNISKNPYLLIAQLRDQGSVVREHIPLIGKVWLTTTHEATSAVLKDSENFGVRKPDGRVVGLQWWMPRPIKLLANNMLATDGARHKRLRNIVERAFRRDVIMALEPSINQMAEKMVSRMFANASSADLVRSVARQLPLAVICELLGLPDEDRPKFTKWASGFTAVEGIWGLIGLFPSLYALINYLKTQIEHVRRHGGTGVIHDLVHNGGEGEDEKGALTDDELIAMIFILLIAGHETTTHLISNGVLALLQNPDEKAKLISSWSDDASFEDQAVDELLRFVSPVQLTKPRYAYRDMEIFGSQIKQGDIVMGLLLAADFDNSMFNEPQSLDLSRKPNRHMAFGAGIHFCLGHQLARLEAKIAFRQIFSQFPDLKLAVDAHEIKRNKRIGLNALKKLPLQKS